MGQTLAGRPVPRALERASENKGEKKTAPRSARLAQRRRYGYNGRKKHVRKWAGENCARAATFSARGIRLSKKDTRPGARCPPVRSSQITGPRIAGTPYRLIADATLASRIGRPSPPWGLPRGGGTPGPSDPGETPILDTDPDPGVPGERGTPGVRALPAWICVRGALGQTSEAGTPRNAVSDSSDSA